MVRIDAALAAGGYQTAMLLQVHDELVFECPPEELDAITRMVKREMDEGVCQLTVPAGGGHRRRRQLARRQGRGYFMLLRPYPLPGMTISTRQEGCARSFVIHGLARLHQF